MQWDPLAQDKLIGQKWKLISGFIIFWERTIFIFNKHETFIYS